MPIKRDPALQPLSREHHYGLLLCWKMRTGFSKGIAPHRIKRYVDWFYEHHTVPHFKAEEKYVFPILGMDHELIKEALRQHRRLEKLFQDDQNIEKSLGLLEEELEKHIRFEERVLFNKIQEMATKEQLKGMHELGAGPGFQENTEDAFWVK